MVLELMLPFAVMEVAWVERIEKPVKARLRRVSW
jgi:hypothetical protein